MGVDPFLAAVHLYKYYYWESAVGFVIQANRTMEFEDGLRKRVLPGGAGALVATTPTLGSMRTSPRDMG